VEVECGQGRDVRQAGLVGLRSGMLRCPLLDAREQMPAHACMPSHAALNTPRLPKMLASGAPAFTKLPLPPS